MQILFVRDVHKLVHKSLLNRFFLWSDTFQLVSVKLTKAAGQDLEAKELSVVLDGVDTSPKRIAFGREVYSLWGFFISVGCWLVGVFFPLK